MLEQKTGNETTSKLTSIFCAYRLSVGTGFIIELVFITGVRPDGPVHSNKKCVPSGTIQHSKLYAAVPFIDAATF